MESQYKAERERRMRREEDLRIAEARIADLESTIKELEDLVDDKPKRSLPERTQSDLPETQASKKSKPRGNSGPSSPSFIPSSAPIIPLISSITPSRTSVAPLANHRQGSSEDLSQSDSSDDEDTSSSSANSQELVLPLQTETVTQNCSDTYARSTKGDNRIKVEVPVSRVTPRVDGLYTDEEMGHLTLEAWRTRLRAMHEYIPDRAWEEHVHLDKVKVLQAALSNFKRSVAEQHLHGRDVLNYWHDKYEYMRQQYHVPENTCTPKELYAKMADGNQVYLHRCVPLSRFYSMLIEDTPGYVPSPVEPIRPTTRVKRREPALQRPHRQDHRPLNKAPVAQPSLNQRLPSESTLGRLHTIHDREDINDHELSNDQIASISELNRKIGLIKQNQAPDAFTIERQRVLNRAETARLTQGPTPKWLERATPPWDSESGEAIECYNDMMVEDFKQRIREIRARSVSMRVRNDAEKLAKAKGGPGGQGRR